MSFGFRGVPGFGFRVSGSGFRVSDSGFQVPGLGFREGLAWRRWDQRQPRIGDADFPPLKTAPGWGFGVWGLGCVVEV